MTLGFDYEPVGTPKNNGNVMKQTINAGGPIFTQDYVYDAFNRIQSVAETFGSEGDRQGTVCRPQGMIFLVLLHFVE